jgi:hypothetical protein
MQVLTDTRSYFYKLVLTDIFTYYNDTQVRGHEHGSKYEHAEIVTSVCKY